MRDPFLDLVAGGACVACARPGRRLCRWCADGLRAVPRVVTPGVEPSGVLPVHAAGEYAGDLRQLVLAHKERSALGLANPLGRLVADVVPSLGPVSGVVLVPVPSHVAVVRARGHDPVLRIARRATRVLRARGTPAVVRRLLHVRGRPQDQAGLTAHQRRSNLNGHFRARPAGSRLLDATLLLVDDVITTGSTLREAQRALEAGGWHPDGAVVIAETRRWCSGSAPGPLRRGLPVPAAGG